MKTLRLLLALCLLAPLSAFAQYVGPIYLTTTSTQCASIATFDRTASVGISVSGTWTGTLGVQGTIQGQAAFTVQVTPSNSLTAQTSITANGAYVAGTAGFSTFQVCGPTSTGTAVIYLNGSQAWISAGQTASPVSTIATGLNLSAAGVSAPGTITSAACPTGANPSLYIKLADGTYKDVGYVNTTDGPTSPNGSLDWCWRTEWNDTGVSHQGNGLLVVNHYAGNGGETTSNQDRSLEVLWQNGGSQQSFSSQIMAQYAELKFVGTPTISISNNDAFASTGKFNFTDNRTGGTQTTPASGGNRAVTGVYFQSTTNNNYTSCSLGGCASAIQGTFLSFPGNAVDNSGAQFASFFGNGGNATSNGCTNCYWSAFLARRPGIDSNASYGRFTGNYGLHAQDFGTNSADFGLAIEGVNSAGTASGFSYLVGPTSFGANSHCTTTVNGVAAEVCITGNLNLTGTCDNCANSVAVPHGLNGVAALPGFTVTPIHPTALASGDNSIYTCPASKICAVVGQVFNTTAGNLSYHYTISYDSGSTWRLAFSSTGTVNAGSQATLTPMMQYTGLKAGEQFGANTAGTGINFQGTAYSWSSTAKLQKFEKTGSFVSGDNTVFTCPTTVCYVVSLQVNNANSTQLNITNETGGSIAYTMNIVPNGGSASSSNAAYGASVSNNTTGAATCNCSLNSGDFISINTTSTGTQTVTGWVVQQP